MGTVHRIKEILDIPIAESALTQEAFLEGNTAKQAQVPLNELVANWNSVKKWGYGKEVNEWKDLFPGK